MDKWNTVIKPKRNILSINLKELFDYRDLMFMFIRRDIVTVYKQTILGPIWFLVQPILTTLTYFLIFGKIAGLSTDGIPGPLFYLSGIVIWNFFAEVFGQTSDTFFANSNIFGKVYFPRLIIPISKVMSSLIKFGIQFLLFLSFYFYFIYQGEIRFQGVSVLVLPFLILVMSFFGLGMGLIFTSLTTKYRDLKFLIQFGVQLLMYVSPIIYPLSQVGKEFRGFMLLNPFTHILEAFKHSFLGHGEMSAIGLAYAFIVGLFLLIAGIFIFNRTERNFMDTI